MMQVALGFLVGLLVGWVIEWLLDWRTWEARLPYRMVADTTGTSGRSASPDRPNRRHAETARQHPVPTSATNQHTSQPGTPEDE